MNPPEPFSHGGVPQGTFPGIPYLFDVRIPVTPRARWNTGSNPDLEVNEPPRTFFPRGVPQGIPGNSL